MIKMYSKCCWNTCIMYIISMYDLERLGQMGIVAALMLCQCHPWWFGPKNHHYYTKLYIPLLCPSCLLLVHPNLLVLLRPDLLLLLHPHHRSEQTVGSFPDPKQAEMVRVCNNLNRHYTVISLDLYLEGKCTIPLAIGVTFEGCLHANILSFTVHLNIVC